MKTTFNTINTTGATSTKSTTNTAGATSTKGTRNTTNTTGATGTTTTTSSTTIPKSLTEQLVKLIGNKPIDQQDLNATALFLLDAISNAVAGQATGPGKILLNWAADRAMDEGRRAFLMGALTHIMEMDDLHRASVTHPGAVVIPAVIAVGAKLERPGRAILRSILHGFEACTRVGMAVGTEHYTIWHNTATCGPFGSAMAVSDLLELEDDQKVNALGNAGTQSSGLWQFLETGAMSKHLHAGRASESGLLAAQLAAAGFSGPPKILEGERGFFAAMCPNATPQMLVENSQGPWQLHQTSIKPWPSCRHTHPVIDVALTLAPQVDIEAVASIKIETYPAALDLCHRPQPTTPYEAKFSLQYCALMALVDGEVGLDSFSRQNRERLAAFRRPITLTTGAGWQSRYPEAWGARITLQLVGGKRVTAEQTECKGDPNMPLTAEELVKKSKMLLLSAGMSPQKSEQLIEAILALPQDSPLPTGLEQMICQPTQVY